MEIARRYENTDNAMAVLTQKVIDGGGGNWGTEHVMSAHPQLDFQDAAEMVKYIMEMNDPKNKKQHLRTEGSIRLTQHTDSEPRGVYTLVAKYTDNGTEDAGPLADSEVVKLRSAKMRPIDADQYVGISRWRESFGNAQNKSYLAFYNVDLSGIRKITYEYGSPDRSGEIEVRLESLAGPVVSRAAFKPTGGWDERKTMTTSFDAPPGRHHVYVIFVSREKVAGDLIKLWTLQFDED